MNAPEISIVIPVFNEEQRIPRTIEAIFAYLKSFPLSTEVIFVDDGSRDQTENLLKSYQKKYEFRITSYQPNRGKGYAVRQGVLSARGAWIALFDIGLAAPLSELERLRAEIADGTAQVLLGNRVMAGAHIKKGESPLRVFLGKGFTLLSQFFVPQVSDFTCGFKCFRADAAKRIFSAARINRWVFDTEILYLAYYYGFSIKQIPVEWEHDESSRVRVFWDVMRSLKELGLLAWFSVTGAYATHEKSWLYRWAPAIGFGAVVSLLVVSPLIVFPFWAGTKYQGINIPQFGDDEHFYLTRGKEVLEGHGLGQAFLSVDKSAPDPTFSSDERLLLLPATLIPGLRQHVDVVTYFNVANALGVAFLFVLLYGFCFLLSRDRLFSLATAAFVIGGYSIVYNKTLFYNDFNIYNRSMYPYTSAIPFTLFMTSMYMALVKKRGPLYAVLAGLCFGLLFYIYFFGWTFTLAFLCSLFVAYAAARARGQVRDIVIASVIGIIIGSPVLFGLFKFVSGEGAQVAYFLGEMHSRAPIMSVIGLITLIIFVPYACLYRREPDTIFIAALIAAGWLALNQQIVTGRYVQYGHYYWYFVVPVSIMIASYMLWRLIPVRFRALLPAAMIIVALVNTIGGQYTSFWASTEAKLREQAYAPILARLNALPQGVVLTEGSGETYPFLVTIYTNDDVYWIPAADLYLFSRKRQEDALLLYLYLNKDTRTDPVAFLQKELSADTSDTYTNLYTDIEGSRTGLSLLEYNKRRSNADDPVIAKTRAALMGELSRIYAAEYADSGAVRSRLLSDGVRYVLWDRKDFPGWDLPVLQPLTEEASSTDLTLYSMQ